jgi:tRNA modification GTPase
MIALDLHDTIAAIASPRGPSARGIVRLSGAAALEIVHTRFQTPEPPHDARFASMRSGRLLLDACATTVEASLAVWPGNRSYTGEPLAEIHTVGCEPLIEAVLSECLASGARLAEPGEFTLRAFLNNRIDLTQAEAVLAIIDADSASRLGAALNQLSGGLRTHVERLRARVLNLLASIEATLDFSDEPDVDLPQRLQLADTIDNLSAEVEELLRHCSERSRYEQRPRAALVGTPNAGKSRLFNALLGEQRAIVSTQSGTTRDFLSAHAAWNGCEIELVDTAGLDLAADFISQAAQQHTHEQSQYVDLLLICESADSRLPVEISNWARRQPHLNVWTKCDIHPAPTPEHTITSASRGDGLDALRTAITDRFRTLGTHDSLLATSSARCRDSLERARDALQRAAIAVSIEQGDELISIDLRTALDEMGRVVGAVFTEDILGVIFQRFCIGK